MKHIIAPTLREAGERQRDLGLSNRQCRLHSTEQSLRGRRLTDDDVVLVRREALRPGVLENLELCLLAGSLS